MFNRLFLFISLLIGEVLVSGCHHDSNVYRWEDNEVDYTITLQTENDSLHNLCLHTSLPSDDRWELPYPVYRFSCGDLTGNGMPEIAVGVIKATRYFPTPDKRLFIYQVTDGKYIRPFWLGSRVGQPLDDFRIVDNEVPAVIRTIEKERDGRFLVAEYRVKSFGLRFVRYLCRSVSHEEAIRLLEN